MRLTFDPQTVIINLITALILALLVEALLWAGLKNPQRVPGFLVPYFQGYYLSQDRQIIQVSECGTYDEELFYLLKKGDCAFVNREFNVINHVNSTGLRDDEQSLVKPAIIAFGDSFTLGWGVEQKETYPYLLEQLTNQKVLNAGMSSFGTAREMLLKKRLDLTNASKIIIQYHHNDYQENRQFVDHAFELKVRSRYSYDSLKHAITSRTGYYPFKHLMGITKSFAHSMIGKGNTPSEDDTLEVKTFLQILQHAKLDETGAELIVFTIGADTGRFEDILTHVANTTEFQSLKIKVARVSPVLNASDYFILDDHINAQGHAKTARVLHDILQQEPLPVMVKDVSAK